MSFDNRQNDIPKAAPSYFEIVRAILALPGLSSSAKLVLICLFDMQGGNGCAWPSITRIQRSCRLGRATVVAALKELEDGGFVTVARQNKPTPKKPNRYRVNVQIVQEKSHQTSSENELVQDANQFQKQTKTSSEIEPKLVPNLNSNDSMNDSLTYHKRESPRKRFTPPTVDDVRAYICEHPELSKVDPRRFVDYFKAGDPPWTDSRGRKVRNWKQKLRTWSAHGKDNRNGKRCHQSTGSPSQETGCPEGIVVNVDE